MKNNLVVKIRNCQFQIDVDILYFENKSNFFSCLFYRTKKDIFPTRLFGSVEKLDDLIISAPENVEEISDNLPHPRCGSLGKVSHQMCGGGAAAGVVRTNFSP